ncbi:ornithine cyclodeaminase family protein [Streptosporangium sp. NPDC003464]
MTALRVVGGAEIEAGADLRELIGDMESSLRDDVRRHSVTPARFMEVRDSPYSVFGAMPSMSDPHDLFVTKVAALVDAGGGAAPGRTTVNAVVVVFSISTGEALAVLDGAALTDVKCAAVTGMVTDLCATPHARTLGVVGTGALALQQVRGAAAVRDLDRVTVYGRDPDRAGRFADRARRSLGGAVEVAVTSSLREAVEGQDVVCTATTSSEPLLTGFDLPPPVHVNCMGSHTPESREVSAELLESSVLLVEDRATAVREAGHWHHRALELEEALRRGPELRAARTVFSSVGHGFLDLETTAHILKRLGGARR